METITAREEHVGIRTEAQYADPRRSAQTRRVTRTPTRRTKCAIHPFIYSFDRFIHTSRNPHRWRALPPNPPIGATPGQRSSAVEHWTFNPMAVGSILSPSCSFVFASPLHDRVQPEQNVSIYAPSNHLYTPAETHKRPLYAASRAS